MNGLLFPWGDTIVADLVAVLAGLGLCAGLQRIRELLHRRRRADG
jgi:hypothetical protein